MEIQKIKSQQAEILAKIDTLEEVTRSKSEPSLLRYVSNCKKEDTQKALGVLGESLYDFTSEIDLDHPDLPSIYENAFSGDFADNAIDVLSIAKSNPDLTSFVADNLRRLISNHPTYKKLMKFIDAPSENLLHVRFANDPLIARKKKQLQSVSLKVVAKKGEDYCNEQPSDFSVYKRGFNRFESLIKEAEEYRDRFATFGLTSMAGEIERQMKQIVIESEEDRYYGFNQITMTSAAVTLAKMIGAKIVFYDDRNSYSRHLSITVDTEVLGKSNWPLKTFDKNFSASLVPTCQMPRLPASMIELLEKFDHWPEAGNKPIFDHFWVMFPDFTFGYNLDASLDLLESEAVCAILLGELDGRIYFLSYWI